MTHNPKTALKTLRHHLGQNGLLESPEDMAPYLREWRGLYQGQALAVARPTCAEAVCAVVRCAAAHGLKIIPQSGNTGLVGGQTPCDAQRHILLSLERMCRIRALDTQGGTMTAEAGCILKTVQETAAENGWLFPLSLASEGSCRIGGVLATNAGGNAVVRYGTAGNLVLGLEVVLADGRLWDDLKTLRKDNAGYNLTQLFIGSEGTLGIITAATLQLFAPPRAQETFLAALPSVAAALEFLNIVQTHSGGLVTACELIPLRGVHLALKHLNIKNPLPQTSAPWYLLMELSSGGEPQTLHQLLKTILEPCLQTGQILDAALAASQKQTQTLWRLRECLSEAQKDEGASIKHDIALPLPAVDSFLKEATAAIQQEVPGIRPLPFGHLADGSLHFNLSQPPHMKPQEFQALTERLNGIVHRIALAKGGTISAEHGIGLARRNALAQAKSHTHLSLMRTLKKALDPHNILNPGKILPENTKKST